MSSGQDLSLSTRKSSNIEEKFWECLACNQLRWRQILLAVSSSPGLRRNGTQHTEPVAESKEQLMELFSHPHQLLSFPFHMGLTPKVVAICPGLHLQQPVSYDLDSDLSFVSNNCILQTSELYLSQNHKLLGSHIFIFVLEVSRVLCL